MQNDWDKAYIDRRAYLAQVRVLKQQQTDLQERQDDKTERDHELEAVANALACGIAFILFLAFGVWVWTA